MQYYKSSKLSAYITYLLLTTIATFAMYIITSINMLYQIEAVRLNALQLVLVGTTLETTCFLCQVPTGIIADTYSRRLSVVLGYLLMGIGFLLEGLIPQFSSILIAQVLWGCGSTFVSGAEEAWCADEIGDELVGQAFLRATQWGQIASLVSLPISIALALITARLNVPIILGSSILIVLAIFLFFFMPERNAASRSQDDHTSWKTLGTIMIDGLKAVRQSKMLLAILGITIFAAMFSEGFDRLSTDHLLHDYVFPTFVSWPNIVWIGLINGGAMLLTLGVTEIVRRRVDTNNHQAIVRAMFAFSVLLIGSVAVFALTTNLYLTVLAFWSASIFRRADQPLYTTWITRNSAPKARATIISLFGQVDAIGQIAGGPIVGVIGKMVSLPAALLTSSAIMTPNILFFTRANRLSKQAATFNEEEHDIRQSAD
ncbi:MAG TPA: MFS transporter [Dictyobacter sp.]|jgi:DHA3 family tetracycline resistance protein-like MFS transporter|nr:MFS transporter [Dictyobacter sp.]